MVLGVWGQLSLPGLCIWPSLYCSPGDPGVSARPGCRYRRHDRSALRLRRYRNLKSIWDMVARCTYTRCHYARALLFLCTVLMAAAFLFPMAAALFLEPVAIAAVSLMYLCYLPTLRYYGIHPLWGCILPVIGLFYLCRTWSSAWRHPGMREHSGKGAFIPCLP